MLKKIKCDRNYDIKKKPNSQMINIYYDDTKLNIQHLKKGLLFTKEEHSININGIFAYKIYSTAVLH